VKRVGGLWGRIDPSKKGVVLGDFGVVFANKSAF
jgi:hypothetical protein